MNSMFVCHLNRQIALRCALSSAVLVLLGLTGCGTSSGGDRQDGFFTSGSREADQRASQRMAKEEQLADSKKGKDKEAKPADKTDSGAPKAAQAEEKLTLYERLGGEKGIAAIVEDFTPRVLADPRVNWDREGVRKGGLLFGRDKAADWQATPQNVATLKKHLAQFLALATGGPAQYDGEDMKSAHEGMQITNPEFDAVIGDLKASLDRLKIPDREQKELLAIVESTRPQIVTKR